MIFFIRLKKEEEIRFYIRNEIVKFISNLLSDSSMAEQTFILIKPGHVNLADKILEELDKHGSRIQTTKIEHVPQCIIERHYQPHRNRPFFYYMTGSFID